MWVTFNDNGLMKGQRRAERKCVLQVTGQSLCG